MESLLRAVRHAVRTLIAEAGVCARHDTHVALGIDANTAIFSVVNGHRATVGVSAAIRMALGANTVTRMVLSKGCA